MDAVIAANAISYASPSMGGDQSTVRKKQASWDKFMKALTWGDVKKKAKKKTVGDVLGMFGKLGFNVPVLQQQANKKKGDGK